MFLETRGPAQTLPGRAESGREDEERPWPPIPTTLTKPQQTRAAFSLKKKGRDRGGAQRVPTLCGSPGWILSRQCAPLPPLSGWQRL